MFSNINIYIHHICIHTYTCMHKFIHNFLSILCMCVYVYTYTPHHTSINVWTLCMYLRVCVCAYVCKCKYYLNLQTRWRWQCWPRWSCWRHTNAWSHITHLSKFISWIRIGFNIERVKMDNWSGKHTFTVTEYCNNNKKVLTHWHTYTTTS